jgi:hypothetical protein
MQRPLLSPLLLHFPQLLRAPGPIHLATTRGVTSDDTMNLSSRAAPSIGNEPCSSLLKPRSRMWLLNSVCNNLPRSSHTSLIATKIRPIHYDHFPTRIEATYAQMPTTLSQCPVSDTPHLTRSRRICLGSRSHRYRIVLYKIQLSSWGSTSICALNVFAFE